MNLKNLIYILICLSGGLVSVSCNMSSSILPIAQGRAGELLIVMDNALWKGVCGDSIRHYLTEPVAGLPAPEPMFSLLQQSELSAFMQKFRNILIVKISSGYEKTKLGYKNDVYAQDQLIFNLEAPSADSAIACMYRNKDLITAQFLTKDRESMITDYKKATAVSIVEKLHEKFQVDISIPKEYKLNVEKENFVWLAREEGEKIWGILMWKRAYTDKNQLDTENLIGTMNEMTKKHVPGPSQGSYMADEPKIPPAVKRFQKEGGYCVQMNGLWQTENDFMGGPYVSLSVVDAKRGQIVTGVGFMFYPNRDKRQYIRGLEAILYTMKPAEEKAEPEQKK